MTSSQYISVRETAQLLGISEKKVMDLIEHHKIQAYRIADKFLRLKRNEVLNIRNTGEISQETVQLAYTQAERMRDFFYFNDFYLVCVAVVLTLLYVIFYT